jgi:hypothetical protein
MTRPATPRAVQAAGRLRSCEMTRAQFHALSAARLDRTPLTARLTRVKRAAPPLPISENAHASASRRQASAKGVSSRIGGGVLLGLSELAEPNASTRFRRRLMREPQTRRQPSPCGRADIRGGRSPTANSGRGRHAVSSRDHVATPPRKSLPLRVSDLSALPQGEGWESLGALSTSRCAYRRCASPGIRESSPRESRH